MKIAMIGHKRVPSREGGVEVVVTELSKRFVRLGHDVDCYNRWDSSVGPMPRRDTYEGVRLLRVGTFKSNSLNAIVYAFRASLRAVFRRYDVIHLHAEGPAVMSALTHLMRIPTVVTIHGVDWQRAKWGGLATRFLQLGERCAARYADELIVLSQSNRDYFLKTYRRESVLVPNGMNIVPRVAPDEISRRWQLARDGYILFLARLVPEKGLHYLIEAYRGLKTDKRLVIAGKIDRQSAYVRSVCESAAKDERILMTDFVQGQTFAELMGNAGIYILPSDIEGMSISLLEALSYGRPCLISDIPENRETAGEHARYFAHGNVESLRQALAGMLDAPPDEAAEAGRIAYVAERFDWDRVADRTLALYASAKAKHAR